VDGIPVHKPARRVRPDQTLALRESGHQWVGRGAYKLLGALDAFGVPIEGTACADLGSSTGGFTEVLLHHGARRVYAIDVGKGQLAWKLRTDDRVVVMEGVNARHLEHLPEPMDRVVGDLSFISLRLILPTVRRLLRPDGDAVLLVKPQFEVGRSGISKGGRVREDTEREAAIEKVRQHAIEAGFTVVGGADSSLAGARAGNVEHFLHLRRGPNDISPNET
jgi:23S rRNA (cytidine1920-2'-O)/16S rRNA (cytidine1409-2'-O)-methyltransferase